MGKERCNWGWNKDGGLGEGTDSKINKNGDDDISK